MKILRENPRLILANSGLRMLANLALLVLKEEMEFAL